MARLMRFGFGVCATPEWIKIATLQTARAAHVFRIRWFSAGQYIDFGMRHQLDTKNMTSGNLVPLAQVCQNCIVRS
jgi:hypothetical protein